MRRLLVIVLLVLPLVACFGGDDGAAEEVGGTDGAGPEDGEGPDSTGEPDGTAGPAPTGVVAEACAVFAGDVVRIVGEPEGPAGFDELQAAIEGLATDGPEEVRPIADQLLDALAIAAITTDEEFEDALEQMGEEAWLETLYGSVTTADELVTWAAPTCAPGELVWSCATPRSFVLVATNNAMVGDDPGDASQEVAPTTTGTNVWGRTTTEPAPVRDSVEAVIEDVDREGEPVEISRTEDRVEVGWLDVDDLITETVIAERTDGGWARAGAAACPREDE